jgi:methylmalonyl-CoA mutase cobalamin-binding domain/chain
VNRIEEIHTLVLGGKRKEIEPIVLAALEDQISASTIIECAMRPAMNEVGDRFARGEFFLPDLILAAETTKTAIAVLRPFLGEMSGYVRSDAVVIGTVKGDLHDIGKNLVIATLEGVGFRVIDLGIDVSEEEFINAVRTHQPAVVGFSALLSTTMPNIAKTIDALQKAGLRDGRLMAVGGASVTQRHADEWRADVYAADAGTAARIIVERLVECSNT